jgi:hypothetical protein
MHKVCCTSHNAGETTETIVEACIHGEGKKCQLGKPSPQSHIHINPKEETSHKMLNYKQNS